MIHKAIARFVIAFALFSQSVIYAIELSDTCKKPSQNCTIDDKNTTYNRYSLITNSNPLNTSTIYIGDAGITDFINYSDITTTNNRSFQFGITIDNSYKRGTITNFINYGTISGGLYSIIASAIGTLINYGEMRGMWAAGSTNITINNQGIIKTANDSYDGNAAHFFFSVTAGSSLTIENFALKIIESQSEFNNFTGYTNKADNKNSHLIVGNPNDNPAVYFKNSNSRIIIDFGGGFELGKAYLISKLITNQDGISLNVADFSHLTLKNRDFYTLKQSGEYFIVDIISGSDNKSGGVVINTEITELNKANIKAMNNLFASSNALIYPQYASCTRIINRTNQTKKRVIRRVKKLSNLFRNVDSGESWDFLDSSRFAFAKNDKKVDLPLESNEIFFYDSSLLLAASKTRQTTRQTTTKPTQRKSTNQTKPTYHTNIPRKQSHKYNFVFMPFIAHNYFYNAGNYNLSGLDGGFITAFSGKLNPINTLGAHFGFSYGSLGNKNDKAFSLKSANLMLGLNYKLNLIYGMYIKARGDFFYFLNEVSSSNIARIKPNNLGFGLSAYYGKGFNFGKFGRLGVELGIDYKALSADSISVKSALDNSNLQDYNKAVYNLVYLDLGLNYHKGFESRVGLFGFNAGAGIKGNAAYKLATSKVIERIHNVGMNILLDNDKFLGYINVGGNYVANLKNCDMEFGLSYNGHFGDRAMSNGGSLEWSVKF